jgi:phosphatidylinositol alpha-1,6-mannosyltransferase
LRNGCESNSRLAFSRGSWQTLRVIIGLFPDLATNGGIQCAGRHLAAVMMEFATGRGMECRLLSLDDGPELQRMAVGSREFVFTGCEGSKARFTAAAIRAARRRGKLVVAAHPNLAPVAQAMRLSAPRMKTMICAHGVEVWEPLSPVRRRALQRSSMVFTPTRNTANYVVHQQKVPESRVRVLPWGLDPQFEEMVTAPSPPVLPPNFPVGRVILTVGRWASNERYKGMDTLITALPRLLLERPDLHLVCVGEGDDQAWLEGLAEKGGVERHVHFFSGLTYPQIAACYAACEIFALPSRGEGFGLVYLEAMAYGKPVVAGAHGGAPEVVEDGVTGYLVHHGETAQLISCLETLLRDPVLERTMGARGKERLQREFRFSVFAKSFRKLLRELCES